MKKTRHGYMACISTVLISFLLPWQLMGGSATAPSDYRFQTRLNVQPENDRFTVRVINASSEAQLIDMRTVHYRKIWFRAEKETEKPERREGTTEVPEPVLTPVGAYTRSSDEICSAPETLVEAEAIVTNNPVSLMPSAYIGIYRRSAELVIFEPLKSAVYEAKSGEFWNLEYPLSAKLPGPDGKPVSDRCMLSVEPVRVTRDMISKILNARQRIDLEEGKTKKSPKDSDRFRLYLNLVPDMDALMIDVVCVNPEPGKDERPMSFPQRQIHMKTLSNTSWQWHLKAGDRTLYESQQTGHANGVTGSADKTDYSKPGNCPRLEKGQLVGQMVRFSKSPMFSAVEKFFAETKSRTATCAVRLRLELYLPAEDGNPREAGELVSSWTAVTTQDYQRIRESVLARMQEDKLGKQPNR